MKHKRSSAHRIAFALLILVTLGCGASAEAVATDSAESSATEVVATDASEEVLARLPDLSTTRIPIYDLPNGFEELPSEEFAMDFSVSGKGYKPETVFAYMNGSKFQMVVGMNFFLTDTLDRVGIDLALSQPEFLLKEFAGFMEGDNVREQELTKVLDGVGDTQVAMTMLVDMEGTPMRVNIGMFRRDVVGGMILSMTMMGQPEAISLRELGQLFDTRIQRSLEAAQ